MTLGAPPNTDCPLLRSHRRHPLTIPVQECPLEVGMRSCQGGAQRSAGAGIERVVKPVVDRAASEPSPEWLDLNELPRSGHLADSYDGRAPAGGIAKFSDGYPDLAAASGNLLKPKMISTTICRGYGL